ncbi:MAG: exodeoxyribonuclease VII small subunit [Rickettsiales bacterium]|jgi:exodeoxyribonuclease VII small subunit|nr:exodeoxyribonuclease VII small subunit [Rickettsiales bacterium]
MDKALDFGSAPASGSVGELRPLGLSEDKGAVAGKEFSFERGLEELESIVAKMERGEVQLADLVAYYERGTRLRAALEKTLAEAKMKIEKVEADGTIVPFNTAADGADGI